MRVSWLRHRPEVLTAVSRDLVTPHTGNCENPPLLRFLVFTAIRRLVRASASQDFNAAILLPSRNYIKDLLAAGKQSDCDKNVSLDQNS